MLKYALHEQQILYFNAKCTESSSQVRFLYESQQRIQVMKFNIDFQISLNQFKGNTYVTFIIKKNNKSYLESSHLIKNHARENLSMKINTNILVKTIRIRDG